MVDKGLTGLGPALVAIVLSPYMATTARSFEDVSKREREDGAPKKTAVRRRHSKKSRAED